MKIKDIWTDQVWSNVIAALILGFLAYLGKLIHPIVKKLFTNLNCQLFQNDNFSILFVITFVIIVSIITFIIIRNNRIKLLAEKYVNDNAFSTLFSNDDTGIHSYSAVAHRSEIINLLDELKKLNLINWISNDYPTLTRLGIKVKRNMEEKMD